MHTVPCRASILSLVSGSLLAGCAVQWRNTDAAHERAKAAEPPGQGFPREWVVDDIVERRRGTLAMPAWQGEPVVDAHVMDLYACLAACSEGRLPASRPPAR
jgi:hypothetical protein